jgi:hypothetical protein
VVWALLAPERLLGVGFIVDDDVTSVVHLGAVLGLLQNRLLLLGCEATSHHVLPHIRDVVSREWHLAL